MKEFNLRVKDRAYAISMEGKRMTVDGFHVDWEICCVEENRFPVAIDGTANPNWVYDPNTLYFQRSGLGATMGQVYGDQLTKFPQGFPIMPGAVRIYVSNATVPQFECSIMQILSF